MRHETGRTYVSAVERLRALPAVFRGADLTVRYQWASKTASQYLYLWRHRGLIEPLGGHSDVFMNLIVSPDPDWEGAARLAMPSAVIVGVEALRRAGWTTQVARRVEVAVAPGQPRYHIGHFEVTRRSADWFARTRAFLRGRDGTLPVLHPAFALADLLRRHGWGAGGVFPDDIEWDDIAPAEAGDWARAARAMGVAQYVDLFEMRGVDSCGMKQK